MAKNTKSKAKSKSSKARSKMKVKSKSKAKSAKSKTKTKTNAAKSTPTREPTASSKMTWSEKSKSASSKTKTKTNAAKPAAKAAKPAAKAAQPAAKAKPAAKPATSSSRGEAAPAAPAAPKRTPAETAATDALLLELRTFGLAYPGTHTKSPWPGHDDLAVNDKTFAYLSLLGEPLGVGCKLPSSSHIALMLPFCSPMPYGLGKSGWVSASFAGVPAAEVDIAMLKAWLDESYRAQAPKKLVKDLGPLSLAR